MALSTEGVETISLDGATAVISRQGAHVLSFKPREGDSDVIFVSKKAKFAPKAAIRGGIPIIFPQFSDSGPLPKHGWARNGVWKATSKSESVVEFALASDEESRRIWDVPYKLTYTVALERCDDPAKGCSLLTTLRVSTTAKEGVSFSPALHTYLRIGNINTVSVEGLSKVEDSPLSYLNNMMGREKTTDEAPVIRFSEEFDRIYLDTSGEIRICDPSLGRTLHVWKSDSFHDATVWNPWIAKAAAIGDLADEEYIQFVCVEPLAFSPAAHATRGADWVGQQRLWVQ